MEGTSMVTITFELTPQQAMALAQFCKRSQFQTFHECAVDKDEAYVMIDGIYQLTNALREEGYSPR